MTLCGVCQYAKARRNSVHDKLTKVDESSERNLKIDYLCPEEYVSTDLELINDNKVGLKYGQSQNSDRYVDISKY